VAKRGPKPLKRAPERREIWPGFSPPADLDAEASAEFARLAARLAELGVAGRTDPRLVVAAARLHSLLEAAHAAIDSEGVTTLSAQGATLAHPMIAAVNSLTMRLKTLWSEMGLTPKSSNLTDPKSSSGPSAWDGLLNVSG
jgi:P27 family predicted phage terminase small subunit